MENKDTSGFWSVLGDTFTRVIDRDDRLVSHEFCTFFGVAGLIVLTLGILFTEQSRIMELLVDGLFWALLAFVLWERYNWLDYKAAHTDLFPPKSENDE